MDDEKTRRTLKRYVTNMSAIRNYIREVHPNLAPLHNAVDVVYGNLQIFKRQADDVIRRKEELLLKKPV